MKRFAAKLGFVHRTLWQREHAYRWAVLLGPPPLVGCAVAALIWAGLQQFPAHAPSDPPNSNAAWAHWTRPIVQDGRPVTEAPSFPLPQSDAAGRYVGLQPGWVGTIQPFTVDATMDTNVSVTTTGSFTLDQPAIPLTRILDAGPPTGLFAGTARTFLVIRTGGLYAVSARLTRAGTQSANCMVRLASTHHRIVRNIVLNAPGDAVMTFPPKEFRLDPGLFVVEAIVGCWRGDHMSGSGELTLMVRHPGDQTFKPAMADEVLRATTRRDIGIAPSAPPTTR